MDLRQRGTREADEDRRWLRIGQLGRPHGVRGAVHVRLDNPESDAFETLTHLRLVQGKDARLFEIGEVSPRPKDVVVTLAGINSREAAQLWTGATVYAERSSLPPLEPGEYYLADLVGATVVALGEVRGTIARVRSDPSCDTAVVRTEAGAELELALVDDWLLEVNIEERRVTLTSDEGLIEP
jgi:16S rRNA processing protein RimM